MIPYVLRMVFGWQITLLKWAFILLLILTIGVVIFLANLDLSGYKTQIENTLTQQIGQRVEIKGDIDIGWDTSRPSLSAEGIFLPETGVEMKQLELSFPLKQIKQQNKYGVNVSITDFKHKNLSVGSVRSPLWLGESASVDVTDISGHILDGKSSGKFIYKDKYMGLDLKIDQGDYKNLTDGMTGRFNLDTHLETRGEDAQTLTKNLNGTFRLTGGKGEISGKIIDLWGTSLITKIIPIGDGKHTQMNCLIADFNLENGVAKTNKLILDTKNVTVKGKGQIDLVGNTINLVLKPVPKDPSLLNLATTVHVRGALDNPAVIPDTKEVATKIGSAVLGAANPAILALSLSKLGGLGDDPCTELDPQAKKADKTSKKQND